jgi:hypothetical protein
LPAPVARWQRALRWQAAAGSLAWLPPSTMPPIPWRRSVPTVPAAASPDAGLNVLRGCEGTEAYVLRIAALLAFPAPSIRRPWAMAAGPGAAWMLNQLSRAVLRGPRPSRGVRSAPRLRGPALLVLLLGLGVAC